MQSTPSSESKSINVPLDFWFYKDPSVDPVLNKISQFPMSQSETIGSEPFLIIEAPIVEQPEAIESKPSLTMEAIESKPSLTMEAIESKPSLTMEAIESKPSLTMEAPIVEQPEAIESKPSLTMEAPIVEQPSLTMEVPIIEQPELSTNQPEEPDDITEEDIKRFEEKMNDDCTNKPKIEEIEWSELEQKMIIANEIHYFESLKKTFKSQEIAIKHAFNSFKHLPLSKITGIIGKEGALINSLPRESNTELELKTVDSKGDIVQYYEWCNYVDSKASWDEISEFMYYNYTKNGKYVIQYSSEFIEWALTGSHKIMIGLKKIKTNQLIGFIAGRSTTISYINSIIDGFETVFLCIDEKFRKKNVIKYLLREYYRQVRNSGFVYGIQSTNSIIPKPFAQLGMSERHINVEKLYRMNIFTLDKKQSINEKLKVLELDGVVKTIGLRLLEKRDVEGVLSLLNNQRLFNLNPEFSSDEFENRFLNYPNIVSSYVVQNSDGKITDFISYVKYQYRMLQPYNKYGSHLNIALLYCSCFSPEQPMTRILKDILNICKKDGIDMMLSYNNMEHSSLMYENKFDVSDMIKFVTMANWNMPDLKSQQVGWPLIE
jgi:glycylpeptide N-tetradecanoyltransferase